MKKFLVLALLMTLVACNNKQSKTAKAFSGENIKVYLMVNGKIACQEGKNIHLKFIQ